MILISFLGTILLTSVMMTSLSNKAYAAGVCKWIVNAGCGLAGSAGNKVCVAEACGGDGPVGILTCPVGVIACKGFGAGVGGLCKMIANSACDPKGIPDQGPQQDPNCPANTSCDPNQNQPQQDPNCPANTSCDPNQDPNCPAGTSCDPNQNQPQQDPNCPANTSCDPSSNNGGSSPSDPGSSDPGNSQGGVGSSGGDPGNSQGGVGSTGGDTGNGGGEKDSGCDTADAGVDCNMSQ